MPFNSILQKLRKERNLTQEEMSRQTGISRSTLGMYEAGKREPNFETLEIIADFFNVDMNTLLDKNTSTKQLPELTSKDERNIQKKLKSIMEDLSPDAGFAYYNGDEPMSDEDRELLRISLENSLRLARQMAKQKFTPDKYRKE